MIKKVTLLILIFVYTTSGSFAQDQQKEDFITHFLNIKYKSRDVPNGFEIFYLDTVNHIYWRSELLAPLQEKSNHYVVKVEIPQYLNSKISDMRWNAVHSAGSTVLGPRIKMLWNPSQGVTSGSFRVSTVKLTIQTTPPDAEIFMVPARIWSKNQDLDWNDDRVLSTFKIISRTNIEPSHYYTYIDMTVFQIIVKSGSTQKTFKFKPLPQSIEPEQVITLNL